ncbi:MAG: hypothetical protein JXN59_00660, partial [Anaerolineae bacterium]|nr:hypothetical protein [Anaerolineae bacterium]
RGGLRVTNHVLAALLLGLVIAYVLISFAVEMPPYDYWLLMNGADMFCFQPEQFQYGEDLHIYYPAPFYSTFCLPYRYAEPALRWLWMLAPVLLALWLARGRAAVLAYPPLGVLLLIGQSSWLVLPSFIIAARDCAKRRVPAWYGILLAPGIFKPHVALPVWIWLAWQWWRRGERRALAAWALSAAVLTLPAFVMRPGWLMEWMPNGRGFEPVNLASIALVPVQLGEMGFAPGTQGLVVVFVFCLAVALAVYALLRSRRRQLALYDWVLCFFFVSPFLNDYDLVVLLPFVAASPRRLLLALTAGIVTWLFAMMSGAVSPHYRWSMSLLLTLVLLVERLWRSDPADAAARAGISRAYQQP